MIFTNLKKLTAVITASIMTIGAMCASLTLDKPIFGTQVAEAESE